MNFAGNRTPSQNKKFFVIAAIAAAVAVAIGVVLFLRSRGVSIPFLPPVAEEAVTEGLGSEALQKSRNPVRGELPDNPFAGETNPFEGGTNAVEKSYDNPLK